MLDTIVGGLGDLQYVGGPAPGGPWGPEPGRLVAYSTDGNQEGSVDFGEEQFRLSLPPGTYRLVFTSGDADCPGKTVTVSAGAFEDVSVRCSVV